MALQKFPIFGKRRRQELQDLQLLGTMNRSRIVDGSLSSVLILSFSDSSFDWDGDDVKDTDKQLKALFDRIDKRGTLPLRTSFVMCENNEDHTISLSMVR